MKILCALAVREVAAPAAETFTRETGEPVESFFGPVGALQKKIAGGETADMAVVTPPVLEALQKEGMLRGRFDLGRVGIGVAVAQGTGSRDLSTPEAFKKVLLAARSIALTDPAAGGTAGIYLAGLIERLGLAEVLKQKIRLQQNGFYVAQAVASGEAELGLTQMSERKAGCGAVVHPKADRRSAGGEMESRGL